MAWLKTSPTTPVSWYAFTALPTRERVSSYDLLIQTHLPVRRSMAYMKNLFEIQSGVWRTSFFVSKMRTPSRAASWRSMANSTSAPGRRPAFDSRSQIGAFGHHRESPARASAERDASRHEAICDKVREVAPEGGVVTNLRHAVPLVTRVSSDANHWERGEGRLPFVAQEVEVSVNSLQITLFRDEIAVVPLESILWPCTPGHGDAHAQRTSNLPRSSLSE